MSAPSQRQLDLLLSMYVDNELSVVERQEVDALLQQSAEARKQLNEMLRIKQTIARQPELPPNDAFYEQLYSRLPRPVYEQRTRTRIPRRFYPALAGLSTFVIAVLVGIAAYQSDILMQFFTETKNDVQQAYEESVVNGWIMPLFNKTNRDEALQYAMYGVIPLDDSSVTVLKVDNTVENGYTFELGNANEPHYERVTLADLYNEVEPTEAQRQALDTILFLASKQIEEGVLLDENDNLAISPTVIDLQRSLMAKVAASLDIGRRNKMERFLQTRNAAYAVRSTTAPPVPQTTLVRELRNEENKTYVMLSRDTILLSQVDLDHNQLRKQMQQYASYRNNSRHELRRVAENLARRAYEIEKQYDRTSPYVNTPVAVSSGNIGLRVHVAYTDGAASSFVAEYVEPRRSGDIQMRIVKRSNVLNPSEERGEIHIEMHMDSILMIQEHALDQMEESLREMDRSGETQMYFESKSYYINLDSLERVIRITSDSMRMELRNMPQLQMRTPSESKDRLLPGVEIRPDYYERQRERRSLYDSSFPNRYESQSDEYLHQIRDTLGIH